ncbi:MAG: YD repeat-containing protein, partial [Gammaproteobacteria bacterium]
GLVQAKGPGSDVVLITNRGQSTSVQVEVKISNQPPVLIPIADQTVNEGQLLAFSISATDPDDDVLTMTARLGNGGSLSTIGAAFTDNGNNTGSFSWTPDFTQSGFYPVVFEVTDGSLVAEETVTVTVNDVPVPDLWLTALSTTTTAIAPGNPISAANTVQNQGTAAAGAFVNAFHFSVDTVYGNVDDIVLTTTRSVASLAVGASSAATTGNLTVPVTTPSGNYFLCAKADNNATVLEQDENNNTRCTATTVKVAPADLIMTAISGPANGLTGATISVTDTVRNQGQGSITASFRVGYYLSADAVITTADTRVGTRSVAKLAANTSKSGTVNVTVPSTLAPGTYYIGAIADYANVRLEEDENNNSLAGNTVNVTPGADLVMTAVDGPASGARGSTVALNDTTANQGAGNAASFTVGLYFSTDAVITTADRRVGTRFVSSLASAATSAGATTVTVPTTLAVGTYYIGAIADY